MKTSGIKHNLFVLLKILLSTSIFLSGAGQAEQYESPYKTAYRYSKTGLMLGSIQPDADGDSLNFPAQRFTYHPTRPTLVMTIESGNLEDWLDETIEPAQWTDYTEFTIFTTQGFEYDDYGRKIKEWVKGANGNIERLTQYTYNAKGLVKCKTQRMNQAAYNALPADACVQSAAGTAGPDRITRYTYNNLDLVLTEERAVGTPLAQTYVTNTYDGYLVKTQTDANGNKTTLEYDEFDRLKYRKYPSKTVTGESSATDFNKYEYDLNNNLTKEHKRNKGVITNCYDNNNRVIKKYLSDNNCNNASADIFYDYDLRGLTLHSRFGSDSGQGVINTFDGFGNLLQATTMMGGTSRTLSYRYDHNGNRTRITHPDGKYFGYTFDGLDRVTGLTEQTTAMLSLSYWGHGKRHTITRGNSTTTYTFDNILRLESLAQNLAGTTNDLVNSFTYIPSNQIHTLTVSNNLFRYAENANRTGQYVANGLNQYINVAGGAINYDANGNLTQHSGATYTYDDENRLTSVSGTTTASFKYDPLGRLFETTIGGVKTQYLYDGDALVAEYNSAGTLTRRYVHGDQVDEPWVQYNSNLIGSAHRRFLHADHQGSIIAHSDSSGNKTAINTYDAFGIPGGNNIDRFGYTGQIWLPELGLYHYKARMYEPRLGRFLQTDPVGYKDQMNLYAYVYNDPMNFTDPTGKYGRGEGWTERQWKKFDKAQKAAAKKMNSKAARLEKKAAKLDKKGKDGGDNLRTAASNLKKGADALNSDGSDGKLAYAGSAAAGTWTRSGDVAGFVNGAGGNTVVVNVDHAAFNAGGVAFKRVLTHESLHTGGLSDWTRGARAYCCSGQQDHLNHYNSLTPEEKVNNPDYLMEMVW